MIELSAIEAAYARLRDYLPMTPLYRSTWLSEQTGANVYYKMEMFQPTKSFKIRGALNAMLCLPAEKRRRGVLAASAGNHGTGVAKAAQLLGVPAEIYLPDNTPEDRITRITNTGAKVTIYGASFDEANAAAVQSSQETGRPLIHPFDDFTVMAGQGTLVCELREQISHLDSVICSVGGGGLISGIGSGMRALFPDAELIGVETEGADAVGRSYQTGKIAELSAMTSIATSLGARKSSRRVLDIVDAVVDEMHVVSDTKTVEALFDILRYENLLVEPAAACNIAAIQTGDITIKPGGEVVIVMCGANIRLDMALHYQEKFLRAVEV